MEYEDKPGHLWHMRYPLSRDGAGYLVVATTRPETMLGDTGVAVNPNDDAVHSIWWARPAILPLMNREIPIVADEYVEMDFGTGCVKMTPAHDPNDFEVGLRHNLDDHPGAGRQRRWSTPTAASMREWTATRPGRPWWPIWRRWGSW